MPDNVINSLVNDGESITVRYYRGNDLIITSVKSIAGTGLAAMASKSENLPYGHAIMATYNVPKPMAQLAEKLTAALGNNGIKKVNLDRTPHETEKDGAEPTYDYDTNYVLILRQVSFSSNYMPLNWQTYWVGFDASAQLIRLSDKQVVWKGGGGTNGVLDDQLRLDVTEFEKDEAKKLKEIIDACTTETGGKIIDRFFNRGSETK